MPTSMSTGITTAPKIRVVPTTYARIRAMAKEDDVSINNLANQLLVPAVDQEWERRNRLAE